MNSELGGPSDLARLLADLGSDPGKSKPVAPPVEPTEPAPAPVVESSLASSEATFPAPASPPAQEVAGASEPPAAQDRKDCHVSADLADEPDAPAIFEPEAQAEPAAPPLSVDPVPGPEEVPTSRARAMTADERRAWLWTSKPKLESARLAQLILRWRVDPISCSVELFKVILLPYQAYILLDLFDCPAEVYEFYGLEPDKPKRQVLAPSGHGLGKTRTLALAVWIMLITHRFCMVIITAPTSDQLSGRVWGELRKMWRRMNQTFPAIAGEWDILGTSISHKNPEYADWCAVARTARAERPEGLQGAHALDDDDPFGDIAKLFGEQHKPAPSGGILVAMEEASGIADEIREVVEGALSEEGARLLGIGNPTRADGWFAKDVGNTDRYAVHPLDCRMSNRQITYTLPYRDFSGRVHNLRARGMVRPAYWEAILNECAGNDDHDRFRVRVRGLPPRSNFDQVILAHWVDAARKRDPHPDDAKTAAVVGLDFGLSGDKHGLGVRRGFGMVYGKEWLPSRDPHTITLQGAQAGIDAVTQFRAGTIVGDANGVGRGAMESLFDYYHVKHPELGVRVVFFNAGEKAPNARYRRKRDQMWHQEGAGWLSDPRCSISLDDEQFERLKKQLCAPGAHEDETKRIIVESKDDVRDRLHEPSGNLADAFLQTRMTHDDFLPEEEDADATVKAVIPPVLQRHFRSYLKATGQLDSGAIR